MCNEPVDRMVGAPVHARSLAALAAMVALTGCGGGSRPAPSSQGGGQWTANAAGVIDELQRDVLLSTSGGSTLASARRALHDQQSLFTILVAYTDFGGCGHMLAAIGAPPAAFAKVERTLEAACTMFQRATALFTRATTASDPHALLAATRLALNAYPLLVRAKDDLDAAQATLTSNT